MKKSNKLMLGVGAGSAFVAACAVVKYLFDKKYKDEDLNAIEMSKHGSNESEEEDRGVSPINSTHQEDEVKDLKADAINHAYKPIKY